MAPSGKRASPATTEVDDPAYWAGVGADYRARSEAASPIVTADAIPTGRVVWLWRGRLAAGTIAMLDGDPGLGKSTLLADLIARLSRGDPLPGDSVPCEPTASVIVSFEDAASAVIKPRLIAAGAVLSRVAIWNLDHAGFALPESLPLLESVVRSSGARLVVIDPIMAAFDADVNANKDQDVRRVLSMVSAMAERTGATIVFVRHLNKSGGPKAVYRGGGSIGIVGAARSALLVERDPEDDEARILAVVKCNLGREGASLRFRIVSAVVDEGIETARIEWLGTANTSADELVADPAERTAIEAATQWLAKSLVTGPVLATTLLGAAAEAGISERTLKRAKKKLGAVSERPDGTKGPWVWWLRQSALSL